MQSEKEQKLLSIYKSTPRIGDMRHFTNEKKAI